MQTQHELQRQFLDTGSTLDRQRQELHLERSEIAAAAVRDPVIAQSVLNAGLMLAALLPLILTAYAFRRLPEQGPAEELLLESLWQDGPPEPRAALPNCTTPRLTAAESSGLREGNLTGATWRDPTRWPRFEP